MGNTNTLPAIHLHTTTIYDTVYIPQAGVGVDYQLTGDLTVGGGGLLTIASGLEIQFVEYFHELFVNGQLQAIGTLSNPIRFTGVGSGYGTSIVAQNGSLVELDYVEFDHMGIDYTYDAAVRVYGGAEVNLSHVDFTDSETRGLSVDKDGYVSMSHCMFSASGWQDVYAHPAAVGQFEDNNFLTDIYFHSGTIYNTCTWPQAGSGAQYVLTGDLTIYDTTTVTILPGVQVMFPNYFNELFINGTLNAQGEVDSRIKFVGPDTLTYGAAIVINAIGSATIKHADFSRMGVDYTYDAALYIRSSNVEVYDCTFQDNDRFAIAVHDMATPNLDYLTFIDNERGLWVSSGSTAITNSNFIDNDFGIINTGTDTVDARNNYWGHVSGPYHPTLNSGASGDEVSDRVLFDPWAITNFEPAFPCDGTSFIAGAGIVPPGVHRFRDYIYAYGTVIEPYTTSFYAGLGIELQPGFEVELGAEFDAIIEPCDFE